MNYPVWDLPFAHGLLIAIVAILHVYVSHFAVGGGLYLVVVEHLARKRKDEALLAILRRHSRFFMLLTLVFGAISGVGIWFTIALINPAGTSALIHAFVWGWAIEWTFFVTEIAAAMVYYYGWKRLSPGRHLAVGWIYFIAAWMSMVVINGILSFQLTPGTWLETRNFWDGFFNPTYWSSLLVRTCYALAIAGLFALWTASRAREGEEAPRRAWLTRFSGIWALVSIGLTAACTAWWWHDLPVDIRALTDGDLPIATLVTQATPILALALAILVLLGPLAMPRRVNRAVATLILLVGLAAMGSGEWAREALRKPFVVYDYMYSNGILVEEVDSLREEGIAAHAQWIDPTRADDPVAHGHQLFRAVCQNCHAASGYNGMASRVARWDEAFTAGMVARLEYTRRLMPPWVGTESEAAAVAAFLMTLKPETGTPILPLAGEEIYTVRCSPCHAIDGFNAMREHVEGLEAEDLLDYLPDMESDEMPAFTGTEAEADRLARYLAAIGAGKTMEAAHAASRPDATPEPEGH